MLEVAHEMAKGLYEANVIDATTMREFDALCLTPVPRGGHLLSCCILLQKKGWLF